MNDNQRLAFETATIAVAVVSVIIAVIVWFIFWIQSGVEETRLKHETCMVETINYVDNNAPATKVIEYCGPNNKELEE